MPLYILSTKAKTIEWDSYDAKVVRAADEREARHIANQDVGDEGEIWQDKLMTSCELIDPNGPSGEILGSFNAG